MNAPARLTVGRREKRCDVQQRECVAEAHDRVWPLMDKIRFNVILLLPLLALLLSVNFAGLHFAGASSQAPAFQVGPAELGSVDLPLQAAREPLENRPALTRGGSVMAAAESSRRKLRVPKRPQDQPLALTNGFAAGVLERYHARPRPVPSPSSRPAQPDRPFLARGPPA